MVVVVPYSFSSWINEDLKNQCHKMLFNIKEAQFWFPLRHLGYEMLLKIICIFHFKTAIKTAFNSYEIRHSCLILQVWCQLMGEILQSLAIKSQSPESDSETLSPFKYSVYDTPATSFFSSAIVKKSTTQLDLKYKTKPIR